jgi:cation-transporting ATPase 13A1
VSTKSNIKVQTLHRYPFSSSLKRMSVLVELSKYSCDTNGMTSAIYGASSTVGSDSARTPKQWLVVSKGAPEVLATKLKKCPSNYHAISAEYMARGKRVLAIACKLVSEVEAKGSASSSSGSRSVSSNNYIYGREFAERDLTFSGFLVFDCELKSDSRGVIKELIQSSHKVMMITGDNPLTAIDVADRLDLMKKSVPTLLYSSGSKFVVRCSFRSLLNNLCSR